MNVLFSVFSVVLLKINLLTIKRRMNADFITSMIQEPTRASECSVRKVQEVNK